MVSEPQTPDPRSWPQSGPSFITGISGFVGQYLAHHLVEQGEPVCGIDLEPGPESADYSVSKCDILNFEKLKEITAGCRPAAVYHLAGLVQPKDSLTRPRDYYLTNVQGTVNLLEALRQNEVDARVLIVSTSKVYGKVQPEVDLIDETHPPKPKTPYAVSKYLSEQIALQYFHDYGTQVVIARPFNHTGPGQPRGFVVPDFCKQIAEIEALPTEEQAKAELHVGDLSPVRDFLDVRDVVRAYRMLLEDGEPGQLFNISSAKGLSIRCLFENLCKLAPAARISVIREKQDSSEPNSRQVGNNQRLRTETAWEPVIPFARTLGDTLDSWRT